MRASSPARWRWWRAGSASVFEVAPRAARHSSDAEIERLNALCERLAGFDDRISLEWLDGWFAALIAGPRTVMPSEWMPAVFGDAFDRACSDPEDIRQAMSTLTARWNVVADQLYPEALYDDPEALRLAPLLADWSDEAAAESIAQGKLDAQQLAQLPRTGEVWALGVLDAIEHFRADWREPARADEDAGVYFDALAGIEALVLDEKALAEYLGDVAPGQTLQRDDLVDEACWALQDLRLYWLEHRPKTAPVRVEPAPGRNDPCPCGSGRKYKRCHGAPA